MPDIQTRIPSPTPSAQGLAVAQTPASDTGEASTPARNSFALRAVKFLGRGALDVLALGGKTALRLLSWVGSQAAGLVGRAFVKAVSLLNEAPKPPEIRPLKSRSARQLPSPPRLDPAVAVSEASAVRTPLTPAQRQDIAQARRIQKLPTPSSEAPGTRPLFQGSTLSGKPLDAKWQREVDHLRARLDELKKKD